MKPYRRANKAFMIQLRSSSGAARLWLLAREFGRDVAAMWRYAAPFPTFLKIQATLVMCLVALMPLTYPILVLLITYFTYESLLLSWIRDQPHLFSPLYIMERAFSLIWQPCSVEHLHEVQIVLAKATTLTYSVATSLDYLCVIQRLLDEL